MIKIYVIIILILIIFYFFRLKIFKEHFKSEDNLLTFLKPNNWNKLSFTDKLKIYGTNLTKEYSFYADKLLVKDYINNLNIHDLKIPKTLKVLDIKNNYLNLNDLPISCVVKSNNASGDIIIIKNRKIELILSRGKKLENKKQNYKEWKNTCTKPYETKYEKHYINIKPQIFVEQYLGSNILDYKFFCFHGKFKFFSIDSNRFSKVCRNFYDKDFNLLKFIKHAPNCKKYKLKKPKKLKKMIEIAETISRSFEFARIDLYIIKNKIYFGEITFVPAAGYSNITPAHYDYTIGNYWK